MTEKYIVDDAGTLIDMETREMYDIVEEVCPVLNKYVKENQELKEALLFFIDVANCECSSNWFEDMEKDCQKIFKCSYKEAKEKYGNYNSAWWEIE